MKYIFIIFFCLFFSIHTRGQNRININENKVIHLISEYPITYLQVGNPNLVLAEIVAEHSNLVRAKATGEFTEESSLGLVSGGKMYCLELQYGTLSQNSIQLKDLKGIPANLYRGKLMKEEELETTCKNILSRKKRKIRNREIKKDEIRFSLRNIYLKNSALLFELEIHNTGNLDYEVEGFHWWIDDKKKLKATNVQEYQIRPIHQQIGIQKIPAKSKIREVFVLPQFMISDQRILRIEVREKALGNTGRKLSLEIKDRDIIKAKRF